MRFHLRVAHLLGLDRPHPPSKQQLADAIGITRAELNQLLNNDSKQITRQCLEALCNYLLEHGCGTPDELIRQLFVFEPDAFWPMLASRQRIDINLGVRWKKNTGLDQTIVAADNVLQSVLVNRLTGVAAENGNHRTRVHGRASMVIKSELALTWDYDNSSNSEIQASTQRLLRRTAPHHNDNALVCLGSIKSNPVCDPVIARGFRNAKGFQSEDDVSTCLQRSIPFVMIFRKDDPHPPSCWGGVRLAKKTRATTPGIYFEREPAGWECAPWSDCEDVGLVYYRYLKGPQNLEMVLGGFSGRSTRCLAEMLRSGDAKEFWPPAIDNAKISLGAFIVKFGFRRRKKTEGLHVRSHDLRVKTTVIPIAAESLASRMVVPRS